jgi:hypothetical protein
VLLRQVANQRNFVANVVMQLIGFGLIDWLLPNELI